MLLSLVCRIHSLIVSVNEIIAVMTPELPGQVTWGTNSISSVKVWLCLIHPSSLVILRHLTSSFALVIMTPATRGRTAARVSKNTYSEAVQTLKH